jgi:hypothetical protein
MRLIEHDITRRAHLPSHRIKDAVRLRTLGVADEDPDATSISELVDVAELLHERPAPEHTQVLHRRLPSMPSLIGCATGETLRQEPVLQVDRGDHGLPTEIRWHPPLLQERPHHRHHRLISPLHHPVLLWSVQC